MLSPQELIFAAERDNVVVVDVRWVDGQLMLLVTADVMTACCCCCVCMWPA
jgi:hypothetical protein